MKSAKASPVDLLNKMPFESHRFQVKRYGKIWFSPENQRSCIWLKQTLMEINEKAESEFKFCIQQFCLKQNKICLNIPWNDKENFTGSDVLLRLHFQNPNYLVNLWKNISVKTVSKESRLIICSAGHDCWTPKEARIVFE